MIILLLLIPLSLMLLVLAIAAFAWAVKRGQFDDLETPAIDVLRDDDAPAPPLPPDSGRPQPAVIDEDLSVGSTGDAMPAPRQPPSGIARDAD